MLISFTFSWIRPTWVRHFEQRYLLRFLAIFRPTLAVFLPVFFAAFLGTLAPLFRASDSPIAIACFLLVTFFPLLPLRSVPRLRSCIAFSTFFSASFEYFAIVFLIFSTTNCVPVA